MPSTFVVNPRFVLEYGRSEDCAKLLGIVTGVIAGRTQQLSREEAYETGDYERGIVANVELDGLTFRGRAAGTVYYSGYLEGGTEDTPAFHFLSRAAESVGLSLLGAQAVGIL